MFSILLLGLSLATSAHAASQIALFTDSNCQDSYKGLEGPNGYPNGSCTDIRRSGTYGSLQVVGLDPGCAVTIYMPDPSTTICAGFQREIHLGECYNSTFAYYSIDMCDIGALAEPQNPQPSSSTLSLTTSISSSVPTSLASAATSNTPPPSISTGLSSGAIAGIVVGSFLFLSLVLGILACLFIRRRRQARQYTTGGSHTPAELYTQIGQDRHEIGGGGADAQIAGVAAVYKSHAVEVVQPPAELGGREMQPRDGGRWEKSGVVH